MPSSSTSWWVTRRRVPGATVPPRTPAAARWSSTFSGAGWRQITMFVRTEAGSKPASGQRSATASASRRARAWSSASRSTMVDRPTSPAAATTPAWRMPPPMRWRSALAASMRSAGPATTDPTGAQSPLVSAVQTVVHVAACSAAGRPVATSALNRRAPSRCTGTPTAATASSRSTSQGTPPANMWVSSTHTTDGVGQWWAAASRCQATSAGSSVPPSSSRVTTWAPRLSPAAAFSKLATCEVRPARTAVPGTASRRSASWFAMVPEGTSSAASFPTRSA